MRTILFVATHLTPGEVYGQWTHFTPGEVYSRSTHFTPGEVYGRSTHFTPGEVYGRWTLFTPLGKFTAGRFTWPLGKFTAGRLTLPLGKFTAGRKKPEKNLDFKLYWNPSKNEDKTLIYLSIIKFIQFTKCVSVYFLFCLLLICCLYQPNPPTLLFSALG